MNCPETKLIILTLNKQLKELSQTISKVITTLELMELEIEKENNKSPLDIPNEKREKEFPDYLTIKELKEFLRIGTNKAYELAKRKDFPKVQFGSKKVFPRDKVEEWMDSESRKKVSLRK